MHLMNKSERKLSFNVESRTKTINQPNGLRLNTNLIVPPSGGDQNTGDRYSPTVMSDGKSAFRSRRQSASLANIEIGRTSAGATRSDRGTRTSR